ncbi:ROK family transcriptional regulator [Camelliibacillus cellulosilyticus]|uniref:ROK family transcriptional regulator n=1 Tax=Camelliibacillus cellulosilyticus TaxID=2174486 RepID=A0ABV9GKF3_9BACL
MREERTIGSFQHMKSLNRSLILNKIREDGPISRADIAKATKLTPPTVGNIVKELLDAELVIETSRGESQGGRKPTMLEINAKHFYLIGLDVSPSNIKVVLTDLNANIIYDNQIELPSRITNHELLALMEKSIQPLLHDSRIDRQKVVGIGVGMHGVVDVGRGVSLYAPNLQLGNIPIKDFLEARFDIPVKVENDARAFALGEVWFGSGNGADSVVCVNVGRGIGAGVIIKGKLFHGEHFIGGEIGHMTIDINGPRCTCGNDGCLQAMASGPAVAKRAQEWIASGHRSLLENMVCGRLESITGELVLQAAEQGDALSRRLLKETGVFLGIGLTNLIHMINPERIVIGGGVSKCGDYILTPIKKTIEERALTTAAKQTQVRISELGDHATAIGAISLCLVDLFS